MSPRRLTVRDVAFLAILAALLFLCSAVALPVMSISLFGLRNLATAPFVTAFLTIALLKVPKPGALSFVCLLYSGVLALMSPVIFWTNAIAGLLADALGWLIFRSFERPGAVALTACFQPLFALPMTAVASMVLHGVGFWDVVQASPLVIVTVAGTLVLAGLGAWGGLRIGAELRRAGKL